jgi:hypothetical protein
VLGSHWQAHSPIGIHVLADHQLLGRTPHPLPLLYKHQVISPSMKGKKISRQQRGSEIEKKREEILHPKSIHSGFCHHGRAECSTGDHPQEPPREAAGADHQQGHPCDPRRQGQAQAGLAGRRELLPAAVLPVPHGARRGQGHLHVQVGCWEEHVCRNLD